MFDVFTEQIEVLIRDGVANLYWYRADLQKAWLRAGVPPSLCDEISKLKDDENRPLSKRKQMDRLYEELRNKDFNLRLRVSREFVRTLIEHKNFVPQDPKHRIENAERAALKLKAEISLQESEQQENERVRRATAATITRSYDQELEIIRESFDRARAMEPRPRGVRS